MLVAPISVGAQLSLHWRWIRTDSRHIDTGLGSQDVSVSARPPGPDLDLFCWPFPRRIYSSQRFLGRGDYLTVQYFINRLPPLFRPGNAFFSPFLEFSRSTAPDTPTAIDCHNYSSSSITFKLIKSWFLDKLLLLWRFFFFYFWFHIETKTRYFTILIRY